MNTSLVAFDAVKPPAHIGRKFAVEEDIGGGGGFPVISIKGKVFTINRSGEKTLVTKPESPEEPAQSLEVVVLGISPPGNLTSKVYFAGEYVEGSDAKPDCASLDGISPDVDVPNKQCDKCALCPQNVKGSRPSKTSPNGKACSDSKRMAVAPAGQLNDPMFVRVPAASLKALRTFRELLKTRKVAPQEVVTRLSFDFAEAYPSLTFKPVGFLTAEMLDTVFETTQSDMVADMLGAEHKLPQAEAAPEAEPKEMVTISAPQAPQVTKPVVKPATKPAGKPMAAAPLVTPPPKAEPAKAPVVVDADEGMDVALDALDFDD